MSAVYRKRTFPMHIHDELVIGTLTSGSEELIVDGRVHKVEVGDVLRLEAGQPHANRSVGPGVLRYRVFYINTESLGALIPAKDGQISFDAPVCRSPDLSRALTHAHEVLWEEEGDAFERESALAAIGGALSAMGDTAAGEARYTSLAARSARAWIDENYAAAFGLSELAAATGLSTFRLAHVFSRVVGLSPIAYRNQRRVFAARKLLLAGMPIAQAALSVGFADQSHLTRNFQRLLGVSPGRYAQQ